MEATFRARDRAGGAPHDAAGAPALEGRAKLGVVVDLGEQRAELVARVALRQHAPRQVHLRRHDCARAAAAAVSLVWSDSLLRAITCAAREPLQGTPPCPLALPHRMHTLLPHPPPPPPGKRVLPCHIAVVVLHFSAQYL